MSPMRRGRDRTVQLLLSGIAALGAALAAGPVAGQGDLAAVDACMERNLPGGASVQTVALTTVDRTGSSRRIEARHFWKRMDDGRSRNLLEVESPPEVRGSAYLLIERDGGEEVFSYLPELKKVRRLQSRMMSGSLFGTDFSYEDFRHLQSVSSDAGRTRLPDAELEGRPSFVLEVRPDAASGSEYDRVVAHVDQETCVPLKLEFHARGGGLRKVLTADPASLAREGKGWLARSVSIRDLANETETRLEILEIEVDGDVPDRLFTVGHLERRR